MYTAVGKQAIPETREEYDAFMMGFRAANGTPVAPWGAPREFSPPLQLPQPRQNSFQDRIAPAAREFESVPIGRNR